MGCCEVKWEKRTVYVQLDERTGAIVRLQEEIPHQYTVDLIERLRIERRELEARRKMREIGD